MNVNYHVDLNIFKLVDHIKPQATPTERSVLFHTICFIAHICNTTPGGSCTFLKHQMAITFGHRQKFYSDAIKTLIEWNIIKEIVPYQRSTQTAAIYQLANAYIPLVKKLYTAGSLSLYQRSKVNNSLKNYKPNNYDSNESNHSQKETNPTDLSIMEEQQYLKKLKERNDY